MEHYAKHLDYVTVVSVEQGFLSVEAQVTISGDGDFYLDWWDVEGKMQDRTNIPEALQDLLFELAEDNMKEDV